VRYLLDTSCFLHSLFAPERLGTKARDILMDDEAVLYLSMASLWEIAIKTGLGKLVLPDTPERYIPVMLKVRGIKILAIEQSHVFHIYHLPPHHKDPFDRLLVAQAFLEQLPVLSSDSVFELYGTTRIWN
jgi:PIN domain nuclease of toxin-antitoxin system